MVGSINVRFLQYLQYLCISDLNQVKLHA